MSQHNLGTTTHVFVGLELLSTCWFTDTATCSVWASLFTPRLPANGSESSVGTAGSVAVVFPLGVVTVMAAVVGLGVVAVVFSLGVATVTAAVVAVGVVNVVAAIAALGVVAAGVAFGVVAAIVALGVGTYCSFDFHRANTCTGDMF